MLYDKTPLYPNTYWMFSLRAKLKGTMLPCSIKFVWFMATTWAEHQGALLSTKPDCVNLSDGSIWLFLADILLFSCPIHIPPPSTCWTGAVVANPFVTRASTPESHMWIATLRITLWYSQLSASIYISDRSTPVLEEKLASKKNTYVNFSFPSIPANDIKLLWLIRFKQFQFHSIKIS